MILNLQDVSGFHTCASQMLNRDLIESTYSELEHDEAWGGEPRHLGCSRRSQKRGISSNGRASSCR